MKDRIEYLSIHCKEDDIRSRSGVKHMAGCTLPRDLAFAADEKGKKHQQAFTFLGKSLSGSEWEIDTRRNRIATHSAGTTSEQGERLRLFSRQQASHQAHATCDLRPACAIPSISSATTNNCISSFDFARAQQEDDGHSYRPFLHVSITTRMSLCFTSSQH